VNVTIQAYGAKMDVLIVGAGFAGCVHARELAEAGHHVTMIDKRPHIGGNAYDYEDENGVRVHAYGPHLFHTKSQRVLDWIKRFAEFVPFEHKVRAQLEDGTLVPLPINLDTVNQVFNTAFETAAQVQDHLGRIALDIPEPRNAAEHLYSKIGKRLTDLFFRPYTKKMWGLDLEDMSAAVVKRIPLRMDRVDTYFAADESQWLPRHGYTNLFETLSDHPHITLNLSTDFAPAMLADHDFCFNAMPIDEYYGHCFGELPYRSIRFHKRTEPVQTPPPWSVVNFTDDGPFTRETVWDALPCHRLRDTGLRSVTREEPCDYRDNDFERYYPVKTADGRYQAIYEKYLERARAEPHMQFIGRCGTYQYLDMDQVINQSLTSAQRWLHQ
jgi:UDP-galactopyranose mutase